MLDAVVDRRQMRATLIKLLNFMVNPALHPSAPQFNPGSNGRDPNATTLEIKPTEANLPTPERKVET